MRTPALVIASISALALVSGCGRDDEERNAKSRARMEKLQERAEKAERRADAAEKRVDELEKKLAAERHDDKKAPAKNTRK